MLRGDADVIAIDGHTLRGARDKGQSAGQGARTRMMVSAYAARLRLTLATVAADKTKTGGGEREAALEMRGLIALKDYRPPSRWCLAQSRFRTGAGRACRSARR